MQSTSTGCVLPAPDAKPKCFRISGIPQNWSKDDLLFGLLAIDPALEGQTYELSLFPACCGPTQTALLCLDICTEYFRLIGSTESRHERISGQENGPRVLLVIDCHFNDLTPLNDPGDEILAELVEIFSLNISH